MAITNFIPSLWSARLLANLEKSLVFAQVVNRDYEGEIKNVGDSVKINAIGPVTVTDYVRNGNLAAPEVLSSTQQTLVIDQAKAFNFAIDDVDAAQANLTLMDAAMRNAAYALADVQDQYLAGFYADAAAGNILGDDVSPLALTKANIYDTLVDAGVILTDNKLAKEDRFAVLPPWAVALLAKDDRFTKDASILRNGFAGRVNGIEIYESHNTPNTAGKFKIVTGHKSAITFASQIVKTEAYRPESKFADALKGLSVYSGKTVRPEGLVVITATK